MSLLYPGGTIINTIKYEPFRSQAPVDNSNPLFLVFLALRKIYAIPTYLNAKGGKKNGYGITILWLFFGIKEFCVIPTYLNAKSIKKNGYKLSTSALGKIVKNDQKHKMTFVWSQPMVRPYWRGG